MSIIRLNQINKIYGEGDIAVHALKDVDLTFDEGVFYSIIGKSGSGKSTLLHILGALDQPTSGEMLLEGKSVYDSSPDEQALLRRRRIGFVFQSFNLLPEHTVLENILLPSHLDGIEPEPEHLDEIVRVLEIGDKLRAFPDELSGGQAQRVAIARALITKPAILLADEPTGNLDEATGREVLRLLKEFQTRLGQTTVLVTHDMEIASMADIIIEIQDGYIKSVRQEA